MMRTQEYQVDMQDDKTVRFLNALVNVAGIREVNIVGSVARESRGNDLDIVLVVDWFTYTHFITTMWRKLAQYSDEVMSAGGTSYYGSYCLERKNAALSAIQFSPAERGWLEDTLGTLPVDFHLMPGGWVGNIDAVQRHLPHEDPDFVRKIAGDARRLQVRAQNGYRVVIGLGDKLIG